MRLPQIYRGDAKGGTMAILKSDKHKEYAHYAEHCLRMVPVAPDREYRATQREMAAEWLRLAEAVLHPLKLTK
jgi:hypothetical protein